MWVALFAGTLTGALPGALAGTLAVCERSFSSADLLEAAASARTAFAGMDEAAFAQSHAEVLARLPCVTERLAPDAIAQVHEIQAYHAFLSKDQAHVLPALAAMFASMPGYYISTGVLEDTHPLREMMRSASLLVKEPDSVGLAVLPNGWIEVNGESTRRLPSLRAAVLQEVDNQMQVVETRYWWPDDPLGAWEDIGTEVKKPGPRVPLAVSTAGAAVLGGGLYAGAYAAYSAFADESADRTPDELTQLANVSNGLTGGAIAAGVLSVGLAVALVVTW